MPNFWFSYSMTPHQSFDGTEPPNSPYTIAYHLGRYLRDRVTALGWRFQYANLDDTAPADIGPDDVVIGHTWFPDGWINRALDSAARVKFILQPYSPGMVAESERAWIKGLFAKADHLFLITGPAWWACMETSGYGDWKAKATRVDMAVSPMTHPYSKRTWNAPGKRGFLVIGADIPAKGLDLAATLARMGGIRTGYLGSAPRERFAHVPQMTMYGGRDLTPDVQAQLARDYDFFLSTSVMDACPTTLLETTSWGLIAACTRESGYLPGEPFLELRTDDMLFNLDALDWMQSASEYDLRQRSERVAEYVRSHHTWDRFCTTVWTEIEQWL